MLINRGDLCKLSSIRLGWYNPKDVYTYSNHVILDHDDVVVVINVNDTLVYIISRLGAIWMSIKALNSLAAVSRQTHEKSYNKQR